MSASITNALAAYRNAMARMQEPGMAPRTREEPSFARLVESGMNDALQTMHKGEAASKGAVTGKADLTDVITAVTTAELTLQTVVAVRDRVVQAYQEIMRMPI